MSAVPSNGRGVLARVVRVLGSFHLAVVVLSLLFVVVLIGTVAQTSMSIRDVQDKYFEPIGFVVRVFGWLPLPLPGGMLLLGVLLVNLLVGGILRMRWGKSTLGILVAHVGIVVLLAGSYIEFLHSDKGLTRRLFTGESTDAFESDSEWELAIYEAGAARERIVPESALAKASVDSRRLVSSDLPFDVVVSGWVRNARPERTHGREGAEGYLLIEKPPDAKEAGANSPGLYVDLIDRGGAGSASRARGILWGFSDAPFTTRLGEKTWVFDLRRRQWALPFRVEVQRIVGRMYPGTAMASEYSSYVRHYDGGVATDAHTTMNAPLRHRGFTLYQSGYGVDERRGPWTVFAVVTNPTDRLPIAACSLIGVGLAMHFIRKLIRYLDARTTLRKAAAPTPAVEAAS